MTEGLKFTVTYGKTTNTGNYESERFSLSHEFYIGTVSPAEAFKIVKREVENAIHGVTE